jgi:ABC-type multidrug transport system ATPase subunit
MSERSFAPSMAPELVGVVPQDDVIYPKLTPRRFLSYAAELKLSPGRTRRRWLRDAFGGRSGDRGLGRRGR